MIWNKRIIYICLLVIILIILFCLNKDLLFPVQESAVFGKAAPSDTPQVDERDAYNDNKATTGTINTLSTDRSLENVDSQITDCKKLIDEINSIIPRKIQDFRMGTVSQTDNLEEVKIIINAETEISLDPITNENGPSGVWTIDAVLPRGQQGPQGIQGEKGETGEMGDTGEQGKPGQQGPWGKDCDKC